jgi:hypothetical protein
MSGIVDPATTEGYLSEASFAGAGQGRNNTYAADNLRPLRNNQQQYARS